MYRKSHRKTVEGWLSETDARIFELILKHQSDLGLTGSIAEIGLHHGKSFIHLCNFLQSSEKAYGIDVFESQMLNLDSSGLGSKELLLDNLKRFDCDMSKIILDDRSSEVVKVSEIREAVGALRFFSIDGGHWYSIVLNDLNLAKDCVISGGVIAVDDYLRPEWPDVARAFHAWYALNSDEFEIIAIGFNKIYLTHTSWAPIYRQNLLKDRYMRYNLSKFYSIGSVVTPVYAVFFLPEWDISSRIINLLKMYHPGMYFTYRLLKDELFKFVSTLKIHFSKLFHRILSIRDKLLK
jgi:hypothetical protein